MQLVVWFSLVVYLAFTTAKWLGQTFFIGKDFGECVLQDDFFSVKTKNNKKLVLTSE